MTFSVTVPNASQSPGLFPAQANTNFTRLKTITDADHQFNDTAAATDGYHKRVSYINQPTLPAVPASANAIGYSLSVDMGTNPAVFRDEVFSRNAQGVHVMAARAQVLFQGRNTPGACTLYSAYNVASVTRGASAGLYTVTFSRNMPTAQYSTFGIAQASPGFSLIVNMLSGTVYTDSQTTGVVNLIIQKSDSTTAADPISASAFIFGG